jgi:hypothetical protein
MADESKRIRELEAQMRVTKVVGGTCFTIFVAWSAIFASWVYGEGKNAAKLEERMSRHGDAIVKIEKDVKENKGYAAIVGGDVREIRANMKNMADDIREMRGGSVKVIEELRRMSESLGPQKQ